jgi:undecaprenyl-diphosphatase
MEDREAGQQRAVLAGIALAALAGLFSFPSGHSTNAAVAVGLAVFVLWPISRPQARIAELTVAIACAIVVGFSRVAGGVHWPSDVVGGLLLAVGVLCTAIAFRPSGSPPGDRGSP